MVQFFSGVSEHDMRDEGGGGEGSNTIMSTSIALKFWSKKIIDVDGDSSISRTRAWYDVIE